jgi:hypothetical protein
MHAPRDDEKHDGDGHAHTAEHRGLPPVQLGAKKCTVRRLSAARDALLAVGLTRRSACL